MGTTSPIPGMLREVRRTAASAGKVSVETRAPTVADGEGKTENAMWNEINPTTGVQVAVWRWTGAAWVNMPLSLTGEYSTGAISNPDGTGSAKATLGSTRVHSQMDGSYYNAPALFFEFDAPWINTAPFLSTIYGTDVFMQSASLGDNPGDQSSIGVDSGYAHVDASLWGEGRSQGGSNVITSVSRDGSGAPRWGEARMRTSIVKKNTDGSLTSHTAGAWAQVDALRPTDPTATYAAFGLGEPSGAGAGNNKLWFSGDGDATLKAARNINLSGAGIKVNGADWTDTGWVDCTYRAGFTYTNFGERLQVRRVGGIVSIRGMVANSAAVTALGDLRPADLPAGFAPSANLIFAVGTSGGQFSGMGHVRSNGEIWLRTGSTLSGYYSWAGVVWPAG